jgi:hypothetical protein
MSLAERSRQQSNPPASDHEFTVRVSASRSIRDYEAPFASHELPLESLLNQRPGNGDSVSRVLDPRWSAGPDQGALV